VPAQGRRRTTRKADIEQARRDNEAVELRVQGLTFREIATRLEVAPQTAKNMVDRACASVPVEAVTQLRQVQLSRYDFQRRVALRLLAANNPLIQNGRVIMVEKEQADGRIINEPVTDVGPKFRALAELRKIEDSIAALCGTPMPKRMELNVITEDAVDAAIKKLEYELGTSGGGVPGEAALPPGVAAPES
jgi:hypothetical protein